MSDDSPRDPARADRATLIRSLNDSFRRTLSGGQVVVTATVDELPPLHLRRLIGLVRTFDRFEGENDPYGEHDFGAVELEGTRYFFKIDYYDRAMDGHSPDAADPTVTVRVLTVMRADEY